MSKEILNLIIESHNKAEKLINNLDVWHRQLFRTFHNCEIDIETIALFENQQMSNEKIIQYQAAKVAETISNYDIYIFGLINSIKFENKYGFRKFYIPLKVYDLRKEYPILENWWNDSLSEWKQKGLLFGRFNQENLYISKELYKTFKHEKDYPNDIVSAWIEYCK